MDDGCAEFRSRGKSTLTLAALSIRTTFKYIIPVFPVSLIIGQIYIMMYTVLLKVSGNRVCQSIRLDVGGIFTS